MTNIVSLDERRQAKREVLSNEAPCDHEDLKLTIHEGDTFWYCELCEQFTDIHGQVIGHEN